MHQIATSLPPHGNLKSETVTLKEERSGEDTRRLWASITDDGDLFIQGQDLGPSVEEFWGSGRWEYEWDIVVRAAHIPKLIAVLGGRNSDNVLLLLAERYSKDYRYADKSFLEEQGIPIEFWSRVGN